MAIKQHSIDNDQNQNRSIHVIVVYIERIQITNISDNVLKTFDHLINLLSHCDVPTSKDQVATFKEEIGKVDAFIKSLIEYSDIEEQKKFVHNFFTKILTINKPSGAAGVILNSLDIQHISELRIPQQSDSDEAVRRGVAILCQWFSCSFFITHIDIWINKIIDQLHQQKRHEFLSKIAIDNIDIIFKSFLIPYSRERAASVLQKLVLTARSVDVYNKILTLLSKRDDPHIRKWILDNFPPSMGSASLLDDGHKTVFDSHRHYGNKSSIKRTRDNLVGLVNLGNTCYMNSVLQALMMTKQFSREILLTEIRTPIFQTIQKLLALLLHSVRPALTPKSILHTIQPPGFKAGHQQDSSEFLGYLLETLHEQEKSHLLNVHNPCSSDHISIKPSCSANANINNINNNNIIINNNNNNNNNNKSSSSTSNANETILKLKRVVDDDEDVSMQVVGCDDHEGARALSPSVERSQAKEMTQKTIIQKTFGGKMSITYKCLNCGTESKQYDSFRDFQLSFPETETTATSFTIQDLLEYNCSAEKLDKDNKYFCDQCKMLCDGERFTSIVNAPANLILTLKYFKYDQKYFTRTKLMHKVKYDETISIKVMSSDRSDQSETLFVNYRLYAAVVHSGVSLDSGHYFTYGAVQPDQWYRFEDTYVTCSTLNELYNLQPPNTPYILFYRIIGFSEPTALLPSLSTPPSSSSSSIASNTLASSTASSSTTTSSTASSSPLSNSNAAAYRSDCDMNIPQMTKSTMLKFELPALEELPPQLREYVNGDNITYENEWRLLQQQQKVFRPNSAASHTGNTGFRDSDNDDPPGSCGGSMMPTYNRFIC